MAMNEMNESMMNELMIMNGCGNNYDDCEDNNEYDFTTSCSKGPESENR